MSAAMQGVLSSWPGFKELLLSNSISKTPFKTFRKWTQDAGWDLSHNKGKPDVCTLSERDKRKKEEWSRGVSSSRGRREEVGMRRPGAVRIHAGAGDWICAGTHIGHLWNVSSILRTPYLGKFHQFKIPSNLPSMLRDKKGRSHFCFFLLLHIKPWWILKGCFLSWIIYLQSKTLSERMSRSQITVDFALIF